MKIVPIIAQVFGFWRDRQNGAELSLGSTSSFVFVDKLEIEMLFLRN